MKKSGENSTPGYTSLKPDPECSSYSSSSAAMSSAGYEELPRVASAVAANGDGDGSRNLHDDYSLSSWDDDTVTTSSSAA